jgi:hypothetical protein
MKAVKDILTILNLCSVQFYGIFDSSSSLPQSHVPSVIIHKRMRNYSQETLKTLKSIQPTSFSQKCLKSGTGLIAFISVNDHLTPNTLADPFQNEFMLDRYTPLLEQASVYSNPAFVLLQINTTIDKRNLLIFDWMKLHITSQLLLFDAETVYQPIIDPGPSLRIRLDNPMFILSEIFPLSPITTLKGNQPKLNLKGRYVQLTGGVSSKRRISDCSLNRDKLITQPNVCLIHFLEKQINFTTIPFRESPKYFLLRLINVLADNYANNVVISKGIPGIQWLTHGVRFEPYKLILIAKLQAINVDSLLQPFDMNIWMALLVASCLFFAVVCIGSKFKEKGQLILWMISTLLSQTDEILTKCLFDKKRWIICLWFLLGCS